MWNLKNARKEYIYNKIEILTENKLVVTNGESEGGRER